MPGVPEVAAPATVRGERAPETPLERQRFGKVGALHRPASQETCLDAYLATRRV
jgi:hypothetical protein